MPPKIAAPLSAMAIYRRLLSYALPEWRKFVLSMLAMMCYAATEPGLAALLRPLLDGGFVKRDMTTIHMVPLALIGLFLIRGVAGYVADYCMTSVNRGMVRDLRQQIFAKLLKLPTAYYDQTPSGVVLAKLTYDVEQVSQAVTQAVQVIVKDSLTVVGLIALMFYHSIMLTLLSLVSAPLIALVTVYLSRRFRRMNRRIQESVGGVASVAKEAIHGQTVVKTFNGEDFEIARFGKVNDENCQATMKLAISRSASTPVTQFVAATSFAGVIYLATSDVFVGAVSPGTFVSFVVAMMQILAPLKRITNMNPIVQRGIAGSTSIFELLDQVEEEQHCTASFHKPRVDGLIEFNNVTFSYGAQRSPVLNNINFTVRAGEIIAIVGSSGSGKTTLASLLPRFYDPMHGFITIDGVNIRDVPLPSLRRQMASVGQHVVLFDDTVANNIAYGCSDKRTIAEIEAAAAAAYALDFIRSLPKGFDTRIGENGVLLSGGQRQRLAIARAILKDAPILILDEATSALDTESERHIQSALTHLMTGKTTLVIAHRLSTIENADRILVMSEGHVVETGTHAELLQRDGYYARLHGMQFNSNAVLAG